MSTGKPSIPKGTRDFSPSEMARRNHIFDTIRSIFKSYGYQPIETPTMENLSTLLGKYGEEGDKLLFKVLNSGDFLKGVQQNEITEQNTNALSLKICEKGLRYDLTVPFARYVVQYQNDIVFPFKRYQIQPVWRADRPQKGRYREFYQCDVDVIGSNSLLNEVELILIINDIFQKLGISNTIKINNRKILSGMAQVVGHADKLIDITVAIDKIDKIGIDSVNKELSEKGVSQTAIEQLQPIILLQGANGHKLEVLSKFLGQSEIGLKGISEMNEIFSLVENLGGLTTTVELDLSLARGLNYYTGAIFEVKANDMAMGSVCGGGRYDDLTGIFGLKNVSGVGISFGADRIYDVMEHLGLFPESILSSSQVMFANFGEKEAAFSLPILQQIRIAGISAELYPDTAKMKKQFDYANRKNINYVVIIGEAEMLDGHASIKNMTSGEQVKVSISDLVKHLVSQISSK
jgi:histidyl-tRNA synthetase